ncbi:thioredoxin peroxidase/alkyl hydroperoxide reductase [Ascosphaera apis ARSEF 7405]|uniref:Thioredoxin peroxidase/alkyl hydroperoxide reductase n=1 Tax=Ascosphaera apis ARSEF 7405 TaxID=392613 RepID=A0A168CRN0_9EURO|nr:thioredoxin peroxidase/alkyl hydroperoxide reductase [Ascosphaera apis ARSEF 7405]
MTATPDLAGTPIPSVALHESSPGNKVDLAAELANKKGVIIGVPAAFSPACSSSHVPGFMNHPKVKDGSAGSVFVVAVNDAFVMKAWAESLDKDSSSGLRFLADPAGEFTSALHSSLLWDGRAIFGNDRSKRYVALVDNGKVTNAFVEPDNTGLDVSKAEKVLA